jgi:hypothetical protein
MCPALPTHGIQAYKQQQGPSSACTCGRLVALFVFLEFQGETRKPKARTHFQGIQPVFVFHESCRSRRNGRDFTVPRPLKFVGREVVVREAEGWP